MSLSSRCSSCGTWCASKSCDQPSRSAWSRPPLLLPAWVRCRSTVCCCVCLCPMLTNCVCVYVHTAAIARQCWAPHPSQRPGFASLVPRFEELAAKLAARRHTRHDDIPTHSGSGRDGFVGSGTSIAWDDSLDGTSQRQPSTSAAAGAAGAGGASARRRGDKPRAVSALAATLHANGMDGSSIGKPHAGAGAGLGAGAST